MKIVCNCGNEMKLNYDEDAEEKSKFDFWSEHDEVTITCKKCNDSIWIFT